MTGAVSRRIAFACWLLAAVPQVSAADGGEGRLAATANGQTVCRIDGQRRAIVAFDTARLTDRRDLVGPAGPAIPDFVALGCLPGDVVAVVCRAGDEWSLRTYRTEPGKPADPAAPLQVVTIGTGSGPAAVDVAVSQARGWLAVTGLPPPLPPVLRAAVAGVRVGPLSNRACPSPASGLRPVAAAISPIDELVLALRADRRDGVGEPGEDQVAYYEPSGGELLRLAAGVREIVALDFNRGDDTLWALAADAAGRRGLWRLDAALAEGRQVVRPALVSPLESPRDLVCPSPRAIVVLHGRNAGAVLSIDPVAPPSGADP